MRTDTPAILFVDDEPQACKWFVRMFADEFSILTASDADAALALLGERGDEIGVLVTDHRMPGRTGVQLLQVVQRDYRHLVRLLATAFADADVAIAAVNEGGVLRILEKPLDPEGTRQALRQALEVHRRQALERVLIEGRVTAIRDTLGFLAHELNTPLATVRGCVGAVLAQHQPPQPGMAPGLVQFRENQAGELMRALASAQRRAEYCQSLVATFLQSSRQAHRPAAPQPVGAGALVQALLNEYPFEADERAWVSCRVLQDFDCPGQRDLLYLVLCTLARNALRALRGQPDARLQLEVSSVAGSGRQAIRVADNGPGIVPEVLARLTREPVTTHGATGGNGMGLLFCSRIMQSVGGSLQVASEPGQGTAVTLLFRPAASPA